MVRATIELGGRTHDVELAPAPDGGWQATVDGEAFAARLEPNGEGVLVRVGDTTVHLRLAATSVRIGDREVPYRLRSVTLAAAAGPQGSGHAAPVRPPMNGKLERVLVRPGDVVAKGDVLFVLEAMKMQNEVRSPLAGRVVAVHLAAGSTVEPHQTVLELQPDNAHK